MAPMFTHLPSLHNTHGRVDLASNDVLFRQIGQLLLSKDGEQYTQLAVGCFMDQKREKQASAMNIVLQTSLVEIFMISSTPQMAKCWRVKFNVGYESIYLLEGNLFPGKSSYLHYIANSTNINMD
jgi:hypothetical protein